MKLVRSKLFRFIALAIALGLAWLVEHHHFGAYFRFLNFVLIFISSVILASFARGRLRDGFVILCSLFFGLAAIEGAADLMQPKQRTVITEGWSVRRPVIGWGPRQVGVYHAEKTDLIDDSPIYSADYTIDDDLLRHTVSSPNGRAIVFFGDSFTFGDGVNDSDTMPQLFADELARRQHVLNLAFTGYGPQQFLREMETGIFDSVIGSAPKLFIFMTAAWHAERTACKAYWTAPAPLYGLADKGQIVFKGACNPEGLSLWFRLWREDSRAYRLATEPYSHMLSHDDVELYVRILETAIRLAKIKYGAPTLIPYIRVPADYLRAAGFTDDMIMKRLENAGAYVIDVSLHDEETPREVIDIKGDGHPTSFAHKLRAHLLINFLNLKMPEIWAPENADNRVQSSSKAPL
jgi:hypothetical protein